MNTSIAIILIVAAVVVVSTITTAIREVAQAKYKAMSRYPHPDGDTTALGPEIFASKNGDVICWQGENYVRQQEQP